MAPPATQRRRRSHKKAPVAAEVPPEAPVADIRALPDEVLSAIISLLPTDAGVRTRAVASGWTALWRAAPLNLDDRELRLRPSWRNGDRVAARITSILSAHPGPARRLSLMNLTRVSNTTGDDRYATFDAWFRSPVLNRVKEVHFQYLYRYRADELDPLPLPALRFTDLTIASYGRCHFPDNLAGVRFPNLTQLTLHDLTNAERTVHDMISACPQIRSLLLRNNKGFRRVRISSPTLISLGLSVGEHDDEPAMEQLTIVDAPSMERLLIFDTEGGPINIRVIGAPNLRVLGSLPSSLLRLQLGNTVLQEMIAINAITSMHSVKILALGADGFKLNIIVDILRCFPCLEKLYFTSMVIESGETMQNNGALLPIQCLETHLKEIVLRNFTGTREDVRFAKFFILNSRVLELMEFRAPVRQSIKKWEANERRKLPKKSDRASQAARFRFVYHTCLFRNYEDTNRTHALTESDPFKGML
ncbi:F-box/FBD/LRR-repeat protein At5g56420-like [Setaria viridis]|uniref:F-box/FBD/LRR-repeat protein At5g56420-like n=1 Tax=Setaria viridis TaxID=4556 RepID=UPI003B3BCAC7